MSCWCIYKRYKQLIQQIQYPNTIKISSLTAQEHRHDQATQEKANSENFEYSLVLIYTTSIILVKLDCT